MRTFRRIAVLFGMFVAFAAAGTSPAVAVPGSDLVVADTAGVMYLPQLQEQIPKIDFYAPVKVVVYTRRGATNDNLNEQTLKFARAEHPEWISADGQKWANGLFIFALDPDARKVGTYFGEDIKISTGQQGQIQDSVKGLLRDAQWSDGAVQAVKSAAALIAKPIPVQPSATVPVPAPAPAQGSGGSGNPATSSTSSPESTVGGLVLVTGAGAATFFGLRRRNRKRFDAEMKPGDASYASVTMDLQVTELNANTIPAGSSYGGKVLERWSSFIDTYRQLTQRKAVLDALTKRQQASKTNLELARQYRAEAAELDSVDDLIADTNALLTMNSGWRDAWRRQSGILLQELDGIPQMLANPATSGSTETGAALRTVVTDIPKNIDDWSASLAGGTSTPEQALDGLKALSERLAGALMAHTEAVAAANAGSAQEEQEMRQRMFAVQREQSNRTRASASILDAAYPALQLATIVGFNQGFDQARRKLESSRAASQPAAATNPTTGYKSSGGSFTGSGSSSGF